MTFLKISNIRALSRIGLILFSTTSLFAGSTASLDYQQYDNLGLAKVLGTSGNITVCCSHNGKACGIIDNNGHPVPVCPNLTSMIDAAL